MTNMVETPVFDELLAKLAPEDHPVITSPRDKWNFAEADARLRPAVEKALEAKARAGLTAKKALEAKELASLKAPAQAKTAVKRKPRNSTPK